MPLHQETRVLPYTAEQMFAVVADVARYPEFLPWCERLIVKSREKEGAVEFITAEMFIAYPPLRERYVSRVRLDPERGAIEARHVQGPFQRLDTRWRFVPLPRGCEVHFLIDFAFKSIMLSAIANVAFGFVASRMAEAFVHRAEKLYQSENLQA
jgi:coenzyme Q-binding protein COQ10